MGNFSKDVYTIERIEKKLSESHIYVAVQSRLCLRVELLKVEHSLE